MPEPGAAVTQRIPLRVVHAPFSWMLLSVFPAGVPSDQNTGARAFTQPTPGPSATTVGARHAQVILANNGAQQPVRFVHLDTGGGEHAMTVGDHDE